MSHLSKHKFRHNFKDAASPKCDCGSETETTDHFFLRCPFFAENRQKLLNRLFKLDVYLRNLNYEMLSDIIFFGSDKYKDTVNKEILIHTINFLKTTKRFERPLFLIADTTLRPSFLISFLHSHLFCKHDVTTLLAPHQLLQISIFPPIFKQCFTGFRRESAYICAAPHHKRIV